MGTGCLKLAHFPAFTGGWDFPLSLEDDFVVGDPILLLSVLWLISRAVTLFHWGLCDLKCTPEELFYFLFLEFD